VQRAISVMLLALSATLLAAQSSASDSKQGRNPGSTMRDHKAGMSTLSRAAEVVVSGVVTDATTGWPLHARIEIPGNTSNTVWTDPATGAYSVAVLEDAAYTFHVSTDVAGYTTTSREIGPLSGDAVDDFALAADPAPCIAPGYTRVMPSMLREDFEGATPPAGWTLTQAPGGFGWQFRNAPTGSFDPPAPTTRYAVSDDHQTASNDGSLDRLITPPLDLSSASSPAVSFRSFFNGLLNQRAIVEATTNDGGSWIELGELVPLHFPDRLPERLRVAAEERESRAGGRPFQRAYRFSRQRQWRSGQRLGSGRRDREFGLRSAIIRRSGGRQDHRLRH
jgi:hypothetical protein